MSLVNDRRLESRSPLGNERVPADAADRGDEFLEPASELVLLVHGLGAPRLSMAALDWRLRNRGFQTKNWGYPSITAGIQFLAQRLADEIADLASVRSVRRLHVVAHSMGSILTRVALTQQSFSKLDRVVMLAPPNHGSAAARLTAPVLSWLCPPLKELSDDPSSFVNQLPSSWNHHQHELGVVEAAHDHVVAPESVRLNGMSDHVVVNSRHGTLPWKRRTLQHVENFLLRGKF